MVWRDLEKMASNQVFDVEDLKNIPENNRTALDRWRLILGKKAEDYEINFSPSREYSESDQRDHHKQHLKERKQKQVGASNTKQKLNQNQVLQKAVGQTQKSRAKMKGTVSDQLKVRVGDQMRTKGGSPLQQRRSSLNSKAQEANQTTNREELKQMDDTLNFVYGIRNQKRSAGLESSRLSIPKWIENVKKFFPHQSKEVLEKDLIERSELKDIIKNPELFEKVEPSLDMVKVIIGLKHMLPENIKVVARKIVKKVVDALKDQFKQEVEKHIVGALKRDKHTPIKVFRNIDWKQSIRRNLKHYDPKLKKLIMGEPRFFSAEKRKKPWQIVVLIDESGSMTDSVIYSIVMASIFASLPSVYTNLVIFDTQVVDLSSKLDDPVDILMSVQLGGGTDITKAVRYGQSLIKNPKKTIMVIISDFYEGRGYDQLTKALKQLLEGQTKILGIAALGHNSKPMYNRDYAKRMNQMSIDVIACTPKNLPEVIAKLMK